MMNVVLRAPWTVGDRIRYPDVSVVAGRVPDEVRTLRDPLVLFYADMPGVRRYVILAQSRMAATVQVRTAGGWVEEAALDELRLPEIGLTLPLASVHCGVRFH